MVFAERAEIDVLLLGTGAEMRRPPKPVRDAFIAQGVALDFMSTGAAVSTYNILLAEERKVAAALIAVAGCRMSDYCEDLVRAGDKDRFLASSSRPPRSGRICWRSMPSMSKLPGCARW